MLRCFVVTAVLTSCFGTAGSCQGSTATPPHFDAVKLMTRNDRPATERGSCDIGVIPIAGNLFLVQRFGNDRVATEGWGLDELVVSRVRTAAPGRSVRRIPFTAAELLNDAQRPYSFFSDKVKEFAQRIAGRIRCERYVVVHRHGGNYREFGVGISRYVLFDKAILYAMMKILVYDGHTFELIGQAPASLKKGSVKRTIGVPSGPAIELDLSMFPEKPADAARNPVLRDGVRALLTQSLDNTLPALLK